MVWGGEDLGGGTLLDDLAAVHHGDVVRDVADDGQVVRDEEHGEPELALDVANQVEDGTLDGDVERGRDLVGEDDLRTRGERPRDRDALTLSAGQLTGARASPRGVEVDQLEQARYLAARDRRRRACRGGIASAMLSPIVIRGSSDE